MAQEKKEVRVEVVYDPEGPELEELLRGCLEAFVRREMDQWER